MNDFLIPANFEDSGKIMGFFSTRNVVEAVVLALPFAFVIFKLFPLGLTWKVSLSQICYYYMLHRNCINSNNFTYIRMQ